MTEYWPHATIVNEQGYSKSDFLYTYSACKNIEEAIDAIKTWRDHYKYHILKAWINVDYDDGSKKKIVVDYAPISTGRWKAIYESGLLLEPAEHHCSECGFRITTGEYDSGRFKYCPQCGADMRGDNDEIND